MEKAVGQSQPLQNNPIAFSQIVARLNGNGKVCGACDIKPILAVLYAEIRSRSLDYRVPQHRRHKSVGRDARIVAGSDDGVGGKIRPSRCAGKIIGRRDIVKGVRTEGKIRIGGLNRHSRRKHLRLCS
jgi:hypothetical protein